MKPKNDDRAATQKKNILQSPASRIGITGPMLGAFPACDDSPVSRSLPPLSSLSFPPTHSPAFQLNVNDLHNSYTIEGMFHFDSIPFNPFSQRRRI